LIKFEERYVNKTENKLLLEMVTSNYQNRQMSNLALLPSFWIKIYLGKNPRFEGEKGNEMNFERICL